MRIREKKEGKRSDILNAATIIFSRDGYHQAKVENIARMAGIGKGTIYLYFESKRHLFYCMMKEVFDFFIESLYEKIQHEEDLEEALKTIMQFTFNFLDKNKDMANLIINRPGSIDEDMQQWIAAQKNRIIQFLAQIVEKYETSSNNELRNPVLAAHCFLGALVSLIGEKLFSKKRFNVNDMSNEVIEMFINGISYQTVRV